MQGLLTSPGVYLRGADAPPPPLGSAVTGFVGIAERGPLNSPQPLTGWSEYVDSFGGFVPFGYLADSVFGFFQNGGEKCWVVRVADTSRIGIVTPTGDCPRLMPLAAALLVLNDHDGQPTIRIGALDAGGWGNGLAVRVSTSSARPIRVGTLVQPTTVGGNQIFIDSIIDLRPGGTIRITEPDGVSGFVDRTIDAAGTALNLALTRAQLSATVGKVFPIGSVVYAQGFRIEADFRGRRETFDALSMRRGHARYFASLINAPPPMTDYGERRRRGFSSLISVEHMLAAGASRFRPADTSVQMLAGGGDGFTQASATFAGPTQRLTIVAKKDLGSAGNGLEVRAMPFGARLALPSPDAAGARNRLVVDDIRGFRTGEAVQVGVSGTATFETATPNQVAVAEKRLGLPGNLTRQHAVGEPVGVAGRFTLEARRAGDREARETIANLRASTVRSALAAESQLLCANTPGATFTTPLSGIATSASITLADGSDPGAIDARYYTGYQPDGSHFHPPELPPGTIVGLATLEPLEEISLVSAPDLTRVDAGVLVAAQTSVLRHCASLGDRFALLDAPAERTEQGTEDWVAALGNAPLRLYGAAFHPWVLGRFDDQERLIPPTGLIAGVIARTDAQLGVNKAPANERVKGAFRLEPPVDRLRHGALNLRGVNCIVKLEDGDVRIMGARTLSDDLLARYVSVRRTILMVKKTLAQRMLWAVFEPADGALMQRIEGTLVTFFQSLLAKGVTASQRATDAFYVKCDAETNPREQVDLGIVVAEVGIALLAPAEFIVLTARRTPDAVQVIEEEV